MRKKKNKLVWVIFILLAMFAIMIYLYLKPEKTANTTINSNTTQAQASIQTIANSITSSR